jgi:peroxidase
MDSLREKIDLAFNKTQQELHQHSPNSPGSLLRKLKFPESGIIEHLKAAEVFDQAMAMIRSQLASNTSLEIGAQIPVLSQCELEVLGSLSGCQEHQREADCSSCSHQKYRSIDGSCNNLNSPLQGASEVPFLRLLNPTYEDGVGLPVGWSGGKPSARLISRELISANEVTDDDHFTLMLMQFGQFLDHDLDMAPGSPSDIVFDTESLSSCDDTCSNDAPCFPIPIPAGDHRISHQCMTFTRSSAVCGSGVSSLLFGSSGIHREQINAITSYLDGSMIYGSIDRVARKLREQRDSGKLLEGDPTMSGKRLLPFDNESLIECSTGIHANRSGCFLGGDVRTNEQLGLTSMHTLFYREHNRVVSILATLNPQWDGERLYQEARRIVVAEWQHMVYYEYLPKILGGSFLGEYRGYDPTVDPTIANAFATAAFRFGHSQIMPLFPRLDSNYEPLPIGPLKLQDAFFAPFRLLEEGGIDPLLRGLVSTPVKMRLSHQGLNNNLTEALFIQVYGLVLKVGN